jgi:hypothetical protein
LPGSLCRPSSPLLSRREILKAVCQDTQRLGERRDTILENEDALVQGQRFLVRPTGMHVNETSSPDHADCRLPSRLPAPALSRTSRRDPVRWGPKDPYRAAVRPVSGELVPYLIFLPDLSGAEPDRMPDLVRAFFTSRGLGVAAMSGRGSAVHGCGYREQRR